MAASANKYLPAIRYQPVYAKEEALAKMVEVETEDDDEEKKLDIQHIARTLRFVSRSIPFGSNEARTGPGGNEVGAR